MTRVQLSSGISLNVEEAGSGPPVVLLHGFTGSAAGWGTFRDELTPAFRTIAVDIVGHGQSDAPADVGAYAMSRVVDDLVEAVAAVGVERAHWLGYSMGGRTALHVAATHPEAVRSLVLIGASPGLATEEERMARRASDAALCRRIEEDGLEAFIDYWESIPLFASQRTLPATVRERIRAGRAANRAVGLINSLRGMGTGEQEPLHDRLSALTVPALLLAGELDTKYVEIGEGMAVAMPAARFVRVPGAGHAAHIENPGFCAAEVRAALIAYEGARP